MSVLPTSAQSQSAKRINGMSSEPLLCLNLLDARANGLSGRGVRWAILDPRSSIFNPKNDCDPQTSINVTGLECRMIEPGTQKGAECLKDGVWITDIDLYEQQYQTPKANTQLSSPKPISGPSSTVIQEVPSVMAKDYWVLNEATKVYDKANNQIGTLSYSTAITTYGEENGLGKIDLIEDKWVNLSDLSASKPSGKKNNPSKLVYSEQSNELYDLYSEKYNQAKNTETQALAQKSDVIWEEIKGGICKASTTNCKQLTNLLDRNDYRAAQRAVEILNDYAKRFEKDSPDRRRKDNFKYCNIGLWQVSPRQAKWDKVCFAPDKYAELGQNPSALYESAKLLRGAMGKYCKTPNSPKSALIKRTQWHSTGGRDYSISQEKWETSERYLKLAADLGHGLAAKEYANGLADYNVRFARKRWLAPKIIDLDKDLFIYSNMSKDLSAHTDGGICRSSAKNSLNLTYYVSGNSLNYRDAPNGNKLGSLTYRSKVTAYERDGKWLRISKLNEPQKWVHSGYVSTSKPKAQTYNSNTNRKRSSSSSNGVTRMSMNACKASIFTMARNRGVIPVNVINTSSAYISRVPIAPSRYDAYDLVTCSRPDGTRGVKRIKL